MSCEVWVMSAGCGMRGKVVKLMSCEVVKRKLWVVKSWGGNIFLYEEIIHYSTLRSEWHGSVFYSRLGICFSGRIIFETQRLFIILMFLRKQSMNSLANWWSVCFKMFFSNGFICVVASATLSHRVWKLFLCSFVLFFKRKSFILSLLF